MFILSTECYDDFLPLLVASSVVACLFPSGRILRLRDLIFSPEHTQFNWYFVYNLHTYVVLFGA